MAQLNRYTVYAMLSAKIGPETAGALLDYIDSQSVKREAIIKSEAVTKESFLQIVKTAELKIICWIVGVVGSFTVLLVTIMLMILGKM